MDTNDQAAMDALMQKVIAESACFPQIRMKAAYIRKVRLEKPFRSEKLKSDREECISGKLRSNETGPWTKQKPFDEQSAYSTGRDGYSWFGFESAMPATWDWGLCMTLMTERYERMRDWCNGKDVTEDTPISICILCIIVACTIICVVTDREAEAEFKKKAKKAKKVKKVKKAKKRFREFLDIPVVAERIDGFRFVIAHMHHGQQMLTGVDPDKLTDFDIDKCNCFMESTASNYIKHNYVETDYRHIKRCLQSIDPASFRTAGAYNPVAPDPALRLGTQDIAELDEGLDIEDLIDDDIKFDDELDEAVEGWM